VLLVLRDRCPLVGEGVVRDPETYSEIEVVLAFSVAKWVRFDNTTAGCEYSHIVTLATTRLSTPEAVLKDEALRQTPILHDFTAAWTHARSPALLTATPNTFLDELSWAHRCTKKLSGDPVSELFATAIAAASTGSTVPPLSMASPE
jgi:hypothetical protein